MRRSTQPQERPLLIVPIPHGPMAPREAPRQKTYRFGHGESKILATAASRSPSQGTAAAYLAVTQNRTDSGATARIDDNHAERRPSPGCGVTFTRVGSLTGPERPFEGRKVQHGRGVPATARLTKGMQRVHMVRGLRA